MTDTNAPASRSLRRVESSALISVMISERDASPSERMDMRRKKETERRQQRVAEEKARAEQHKSENRIRAGEEMFQQRWHATEAEFQQDTHTRQMVLRSLDKLTRTIPRRDNPRVLIVSDHPWRQGFYVELLRMVGCQCDTTRSLSVGVTMAAPLILRTPETSYDLIIVDRPRKATDAEAAQMLLDFTYSVRVRDAVYRKEYLTTATNQFLFVLGATDFMPQFLVVQGASSSASIGTSTSDDRADIACIRRPLYFHLKKIRQLVLPPFVNTRLRFRLYRRDPNFIKIDRMFRQVTPPRKDKADSSLTTDPNASIRSKGSPRAGGGGGAEDEEGAKKKHFVTFESLQQENEDLHNLVITHIRNKARLEDQVKELEGMLKDMQERFRYTIQGLEGQLRDKDLFIAEIGDVARELKQKLHDAQIRDMQLQSHLAQVQRKSKKKDLVAAETPRQEGGEGGDGAGKPAPPPPLVVRVPVMSTEGLGPTSPTALGAVNAALGQRLESLMQQQVEESRRRKVMLDSVGEGFNDARISKEAKLHAVEINSKPLQCDIWYQSPQEQAELMKFMATQYGSPAAGAKSKKHASSSHRSKSTTKPSAAGGEQLAAESTLDTNGNSRVQSRSQSRQQNSRGGATSRASSVNSAEDEFPMSPGGLMELHSPFDSMFRGATVVDGDDAAARNLRVENNALRKQLQFFKAQQQQQRRLSVDLVGASLNGLGGAHALTTFSPVGSPQHPNAKGQLMSMVPSAEILVADGRSDVKFLHKKIAALSQQVSVLESSVIQARLVGSPSHPHPSASSPRQDSAESTPPPPPLLSPQLLAVGSLSGLIDADTILPPPLAAGSITEAEVTALRETISRLEYKVHSLDLSRITSTMQKLVYKSAMMRLLSGEGGGGNNSSHKKNKAFTKDTAVNTTLEGVGAAAAMWDGGTLFSPKEMEQRINELGVKLKESHMMFKESQEQHLQSERKALEMKLEMEKMHNHTLELVDTIKAANKKLATVEASLKESQEKCTVLESQITKLREDVSAQETLIIELRYKPMTIPVGCQTKHSGDIVKKPTGGGGGGAGGASKMLEVMKSHGHDGSITPRVHDGDTPSQLLLGIGGGYPQKKAATPRVHVDHHEGSAPRGGLTSAGSEFSSTLDFSTSMQMVMDGAPTNEEIDFLVTTRMAALALYSTAQVDGSDVPRKEHEEIVMKLQKDITEALNTIRKLNEVRNAQRTEVNEQRVMLRDIKEQKHSVPELREKIESLSQDLEEQIRNATKRERLLRKEFDLLRLKYAHDDDNIAMAAFDIDAFAQHTLKTPLDMSNDRSTKYVCKGVEHCLGVARRLLSTVQNRATVVLQNVQSQTPASFVPQAQATTNSAAENDTVDPRLRRRSVSILDGAGGTANDPKQRGGRVGIPFQTRTSRSSSVSAEASISPPVETANADVQTVFLPPYCSDAEVQCTLGQELQAALPPRRSTHRASKLGPGAIPVQRRSDAVRRNSTPDAAAAHGTASPTYHITAQSPTASLRDVPNSTFPDDDPAHAASYRGATPMQRSSLLHTPASRQHHHRHHHSHATPTDEDYTFGSEPSSAMFGSAGHYESVPLLETRCAEVQTDPPPLDLPHVTGIIEWLEQVDEIQNLMFEATQSRGASTNDGNQAGMTILDASTVFTSPLPLAAPLPTAPSASVEPVATLQPPLATIPTGLLLLPAVTPDTTTLSSDSPAPPPLVSIVHERGGASVRAIPGHPPHLHAVGARSRRMSNTAVSWIEPRMELVAAVRSALSSILCASAEDILQMSTTTGSISTPSPRAGVAASVKFTPGTTSDVSLRIPDAELAFANSSSLLPASVATHIQKSAATPRGSVAFAGIFTPRDGTRGSAVAPVVTFAAVTQTDPVDIRPAFSIFGGTFDQKVTTSLPPAGVAATLRSITLRPPHEDVGVQVELLLDHSSSDSSSDDDVDVGGQVPTEPPSASQAYSRISADVVASLLKPTNGTSSPATRSPRVKPWGSDSPPPTHLPAAVIVVTPRDAPTVEEAKQSKRHSKGSRSSSVAPPRPVCMDATSQTESDANPSKLLTSVTALHQSFHKLISKLRVPLRLGGNASDQPLYSAHPTVKVAVEWCLKYCTMVDLIIEKLSVAQRGLRNLGLHGIDLSIASLNVLVGDGGEEGGDAEQLPMQRHFSGGDAAAPSGGGRGGGTTLPPLLKTAGRHNPLLGSFPPPASKKHEASHLAAPGRQANITMTTEGVTSTSPLPPIRVMEDAYLQAAAVAASAGDQTRKATPTAVEPGRASGSPAAVGSVVGAPVGVPVTPTREMDPRKAQKAAAATIAVSTPQPQATRVPPPQRPAVHTNKSVHTAVGAHSSISSVVSLSTPPLTAGNLASSLRSLQGDAGGMSIGVVIGDHDVIEEVSPQRTATSSVSVASPRIVVVSNKHSHQSTATKR